MNGTIVDPDGAAVSGVDVQLRTPKGAIIRHSVSDAQGNFHWQPVSPDQYVLEVSAKYGFEAYSAPIHFTRLSEPFLKIQLALSSVQAQVTVESAKSSVTTDPTENRDQVAVSSQMLEKVPVFDQNYIAALTPFLDQSGVGTNGVTIIVDGVEMKGTGVSASAIAEAHINNDPYSAETNRPGKGRIEIITKPGTPQVHGSFTFTFRDSVFDAKNYFAITKPFEQKRIYEGSITGPLGRDHKTTFLVSGTRQEDNLQAIVHAQTPTGLISTNVQTPIHDTEVAFRISHEFSAKHRVSLQYNVTDTTTRNQGAGGLILGQSGVNAQAREDDVIFNDRLILSPTLLNQLQLFFEKDYNPTRSVSPLQKIVVDGAFTDGGAQADLLATENNLKINDIVSWSKGRHYLKFGVNIPNLSRRAWEDNSNRQGTFNFSSLSDYVANRPYSFTQQAGVGRTVFWMNEIGTFIQDQIQVRLNLQVSLGLRYDWQTYFKSIHDFAPRISFAYSTKDHKTVLRGGSGLFYDRTGATPMADLKRYNGVVLRSYTVLNPAYPSPLPPGIPRSSLPTNLVQLAPDTHIPYIAHYSFGIERQLGKELTVAATYRGLLGLALFRSRDINAPLPPFYASRPNTNLGVVRQIESEGRQVGNALDLTLEGKTGRWFSGLAQYTFSRTNNNTGGIAWFPANQYDLTGEYSRADFDQRHRFNLLGTLNEDHWLNLGVGTKLYSGMPYTETSGVDMFNTGILNARPAGIKRNSLETGGNVELDLRWNHDMHVPSKKGDRAPLMSFAIDGFNVTNRTNLSSYVGNIQSTFFGRPTAALPARRLQFSAHIKF
ncbi:MAG TPA: carboxypeptidase regulatory-like domain-containing protein [Edaphobacter sp.]|nr:carboxypeptidase regulatory-like domain-containing protein [Edaphobacter sp.]